MAMANEVPVKDFYKRVIGWIETKPNGDKVAKDFWRRVVGFYDKALNITTDFYKRKVGDGDQTMGLIWAEEEKRKAKLAANKK